MEKIVQITAGRGPAECMRVVARILSIFLKEAKEKQIQTEVLHREKGQEHDTLLSASIWLQGESLDEFIDSWQGSILWIGQSPFRKFHKRKNWFIGIKAHGNLQSNEIQEHEISYSSLRAGGPGGQHVNKVETAVRATHLPTGLAVVASDSRSQHQNKKKARERLLTLIALQAREKNRRQEQDNWQNHNELERGNPIRTYKGKKF